MTVHLQLPKPRLLPLKKAQKTSSKRGVITISLMNPPLTYRIGSKRVHKTGLRPKHFNKLMQLAY